jgi:23S rRNA (pseudouridine1915-N3)-methyltransferase
VLLHIVARGKIGRSPEAELFDRYVKRIQWPMKVSELPESGGRLPPPTEGQVTILLDERGDMWSSEAFAAELSRWRDQGKREARFMIGGADGFGNDERAVADRLLSFGRATWPHLMVRAMLAEQLYRASTIIAGHPYHRSG